MRESTIHSNLRGGQVRALRYGTDYALDNINDVRALNAIGIGGFERLPAAYARFGADISYGLDSVQQPVTTPSVGTPVQWLQAQLPGFVNVATVPRKIDDIIGRTTIGAWHDEQVIQGIMENTGTAQPYGDLTNTPLSDYNVNFTTRTVVRFENGMRVGILEAARVAQMRVSADDSKRAGAALNLDTIRNQVGFYGYNSGNNNTYGFLNDPQLPGYQTVATGSVSSSKLWSLKTMEEITADILTAVNGIMSSSQGLIDPLKQATTLTVPTNCYQFLNKINTFGLSAYNWIKQTYPMMRVENCVQFQAANGGSNIFYLFADSVSDSVSSDGGSTFVQMVPAIFQVLGVQQLSKGYEEAFSNATAGVMCKRPYAVYRATGI